MEWTAAAIAVQRVTRGKLHRLSWSRGEQKKALAAMTLKIKLGAVVSKRMFRKRLMQRRAEHGEAQQKGERGHGEKGWACTNLLPALVVLTRVGRKLLSRHWEANAPES